MKTERDTENGRRHGMERGSALGGAPWGRSPLNLRLGLAAFGLVASVALAVLSFAAGLPWLGVVMAVIAAVALADAVVVGRRVVRRRRRGEHHSLFE
ncbi:DUF6343 family protein [Actinomadura rayongensis]|nr:DUF6343 family protein [Actinomadura rayongensis]